MEYYDDRICLPVCLSVCLSASISLELRIQSSPNLSAHRQWSLLGGRAAARPLFGFCRPPLSLARPLFGGDVNFFFLYIAIMTGENLQ